jgi:hypothetical protein
MAASRRAYLAPWVIAVVGALVPAGLNAQGVASSGPRVLGEAIGTPAPAEIRRSTRGLSGALRAAIVLHTPIGDASATTEARLAGSPAGETDEDVWIAMFDPPGDLLGEPVGGATRTRGGPDAPGIYTIERWNPSTREPAEVSPVSMIAAVPFAAKTAGHLNGYHIGRYPVEGSGRLDRYAPPIGFIEVTRENQDFRISEHFRLRDFLTKDQFDIWPKYLALDLRLIDKLELVLQELNAMGVRADRLHVMSGFRTPQYNGPGENGRATLSRHTYGDAADVWVDNDGDGYMDDLNQDGRMDLSDARVILRAVERVEARHPELIGGAGLYVANSAHGPFIHIDARGIHSRW